MGITAEACFALIKRKSFVSELNMVSRSEVYYVLLAVMREQESINK